MDVAMAIGFAAPVDSNQQFDWLVNLLARRLPDWGYRQTAAEESGLPSAQYAGDPRTGWRTLVREAVEKGRVAQLLRAAADIARGDEELDELAAAAEEGRLKAPMAVPPVWIVGGVAVAGVAASVGLAAIGLVAWLSSGAAEQAADVADQEHAPVHVATAGPQDAFVAAAAASSEGASEDDEGTDPVEPEPPAPEVALAVGSAQPTRHARGGDPEFWAKVGPDACGGQPGEVVGYAFYDMRRPGRSETVWTIDRDMNVRDEYPQRSNHWDVQSTEVVCILMAGTEVRIQDSAPPIRVEGGAYWVPIVSGAIRAR